MTERFSAIESALLNVFRQKGARAGDLLPGDVLRDCVALSGGPGSPDAIETALLNLEFRGVIAPGPDPYSATSWMLTTVGDAIVIARR